MKALSVFDVIGPKMIGPSSSHTAGALRIASVAAKFIEEPIVKAVFVLYGSFAETYRGHGTDKALVGGVLGYDTSDIRIADSFNKAAAVGLEFSFVPDKQSKVDHANTVGIRLTGKTGQQVEITGASLGGGEIEIRSINGIDVQFRGEYFTLLVPHRDTPGVVAFVTQTLSDAKINIAFMKLFRESKGDLSYLIIEADHSIPNEVTKQITAHSDVFGATTLKGW